MELKSRKPLLRFAPAKAGFAFAGILPLLVAAHCPNRIGRSARGPGCARPRPALHAEQCAAATGGALARLGPA